MRREGICWRLTAKIEYDEELKQLTLQFNNGACKWLSIRELETVEKILDLLDIPYEEKLGNMLGDIEFVQYQYENDSLYKMGYEAGKMID